MTIPAFKQLKQSTRVTQTLQSNVAATLGPLLNAPLAGAVVATFTANGAIPAGTNITVAHGLGTSPRGIIPLLALQSNAFPANASWVQSTTPSPDADVFMVLQCSATLGKGATFRFLVY